MALGARLFLVEPDEDGDGDRPDDEPERESPPDAHPHRDPGDPDPIAPLPERVPIYEVGPRDGLQNEKALVPTEVKAEFVRRLLAAGLPVVEATSFVHPRWVPQLADAADLMSCSRRGPAGLGDASRDLPVLVPNERGLDRALELGARHIAIFGSATETFAQKNLNRSLDEQFAMFEPTVRRAREHGLDVRAYVSMCFGDPWEGAVPVEQVVAVGKRLFDLGASQLSLGDTIGVGTAGHVTALVRGFVEAGMGLDQLAMHFHDTYGQALANTYAGAPGRHHDVRRQRRRPGRLPLRQERHRQPRHRGPGLDAARPRHRDRRRPRGGGRHQRLDGRPPRPPLAVRGGPRPRPGDAADRYGTIWRMSRAVYLHIGAPKTGTTYVQDRLALNARSLARHDVHVPTRPLVSPGLFHFRAALDLLGQDWGGAARPRGGRLGRAGPKRVRRSSGTVDHQPRDPGAGHPEQVARAMADLADSEVHVVYSARDLARQLPAAWQESIKQGRTWSFRRFLNRTEGEGPWFFRAFDLPRRARHVGRGAAARAGARGHRAAAAPGARAPRTCCGCGCARRSASTRPGRPGTATAPTARSASPRPRSSASSTGASTGPPAARRPTTT